MKTSVAITLIICGTVLLCVPHITNLTGTSQARLLLAAELEIPTVNLTGVLPPYHNIACLLAGLGMIVAGIIAAAKSGAK